MTTADKKRHAGYLKLCAAENFLLYEGIAMLMMSFITITLNEALSSGIVGWTVFLLITAALEIFLFMFCARDELFFDKSELPDLYRGYIERTEREQKEDGLKFWGIAIFIASTAFSVIFVITLCVTEEGIFLSRLSTFMLSRALHIAAHHIFYKAGLAEIERDCYIEKKNRKNIQKKNIVIRIRLARERK